MYIPVTDDVLDVAPKMIAKLTVVAVKPERMNIHAAEGWPGSWKPSGAAEDVAQYNILFS